MRKFAFQAKSLIPILMLAGCGGGGGGGIASVGTTPPPVAPPPPPPTAAFALLLKPPATDQQLATIGASFEGPATQTPALGSANQLQVRYVASSNTYEVELPNAQTWIALVSKSEVEASGGGVVASRQWANDYGSIFRWGVSNSVQGVEATGLATAASGIPVSGSATYSAQMLGATSERAGGFQIVDPSVYGEMTLNFDFGVGTLSGRITSYLDPEWHDYQLGTLNFRDTVYSVGKTNFSGKFDTPLPGVNAFEGVFTGPAAQGVIGNFAFPYKSPIDGQTYQVGGAFAGRK